ncbi:MAG TPA: hypothetical protein VMQ93_13175 [Novosphingobium sp.]|nr:hypothetical protein [Novosphingobium sp.]
MIDLVRGPLPIHFFSIVVKASAVDRAFPGGREEFIRAHRPGSFNGALFCLTSMGPESVEWHLTQLEAAGVILGIDAALADMAHGPEVECPGMVFACDGELFGARWTVDAKGVEDQPERVPQEAPGESVQHVGDNQAFTPSGRPKEPPATPATPWRRHAPRGGLVYWFGGDEDDEEH